MKTKKIIFIGIIATVVFYSLFFLLIKLFVPSALTPLNEFGKIPFCNQNVDRAIIINGFVFPLCARCTFMVFFYVMSLSLSNISCLKKIIVKTHPLILIILIVFLMLPLAIDGIRVYFTSYEGKNITRMITGALFGIGCGILTQFLIYILFEKNSIKRLQD